MVATVYEIRKTLANTQAASEQPGGGHLASKTGLRDLFAIAFLHIEIRRVFISRGTYHPEKAWVLEQAEVFKLHVKKEKIPLKLLMHDRNTSFTKSFNETFASKKSAVKISAFRSPNNCAFVERFIQTVKQKYLDHFVVFGRNHFDHICEQFAEHYHLERPHQSQENVVISDFKKKQKKPSIDSPVIKPTEIRCQERLGGLLKHYSKRAA
jgi:putative transposase